jgi:hypothetical protein
MWLTLASVLMRDQRRPAAALRVLEQIPHGSLLADLEATRQNLPRMAERMRPEVEIELEGED